MANTARSQSDIPENFEIFEWGGLEIPARLVVQGTTDQNAQAIRQGPEGQRADQQGTIKAKFSDFIGGLFCRIGDWQRDLNRYAYNEGLVTHIPGGLYLPFKLTTQTALSGGAKTAGSNSQRAG